MFALNFLLIALCFVAYIIECKPEKEEPQLSKMSNLECIENTKADPVYVQKIKNGEWDIPKVKLQKIKAWALCMMTKAGLMSKQGVYQLDVALAQVPSEAREAVQKAIDKCLSKKALPPVDIALNFVRCYQTNEITLMRQCVNLLLYLQKKMPCINNFKPVDKANVESLIDSCLSKKALPAPDIAMMFIKCYQKAKGNYTVTVL